MSYSLPTSPLPAIVASARSFTRRSLAPRILDAQPHHVHPHHLRNSLRQNSDVNTTTDVQSDQPEEDPELRLPKRSSLAIIIALNAMSQVTMFIIVSSVSKYSEFLGGSATFSGLVLGIPVVFAGIALPPLMKLDHGQYARPIHFSCGTAIIGHVLYGLAYYTKFLWLILIGRSVIGLAMANFMYSKRYCSDARIVGIRRRTTLAGWLVLGQGIGLSAGPFIGGLLYKIGFGNRIFNGYTSPGWVMAGLWLVYWIIVARFFEDVPRDPIITPESPPPQMLELPKDFSTTTSAATSVTMLPSTNTSASPALAPYPVSESTLSPPSITRRQWGVIVTMCWFAMTCFFTLGAWEANIPVYTAVQFGWSPFAAGNFLALGGLCTFPLLFINLHLVRRVQDRYILAFGATTGLCGLLITLLIIQFKRVTPVSLFMCWFLVALGYNVASTVTMSLLSKQMDQRWNGRISLAIQYSNFGGRVCGAVWGGAGVSVGMKAYLGMELAVLGVGGVLFLTLWRSMKAKTG